MGGFGNRFPRDKRSKVVASRTRLLFRRGKATGLNQSLATKDRIPPLPKMTVPPPADLPVTQLEDDGATLLEVGAALLQQIAEEIREGLVVADAEEQVEAEEVEAEEEVAEEEIEDEDFDEEVVETPDLGPDLASIVPDAAAPAPPAPPAPRARGKCYISRRASLAPNPVKGWSCSFCGLNNMTKKAIEGHYAAHKNQGFDKNFNCSHCNNLFRSTYERDIHKSQPGN